MIQCQRDHRITALSAIVQLYFDTIAFGEPAV